MRSETDQPGQQQKQLKRFGANVRRLRILRDLTQEQLAEASGLHPRTVQKIEAGAINVLITTVLRLKAALKCSWEELLSMNEKGLGKSGPA